MPLYEYECAECGERFERLQKFSDPPIETCPQCGGHVSRLLSSPAIQFKGSGWYATDYARAGRSDVAGKSSTEGESSKPAKSEPGAKPSKETESGTKTSQPGKK